MLNGRRRPLKKKIRALVILLGWILVWQLAAVAIRNPILFASPQSTAAALLQNLGNGDFWLVVGKTLMRIGTGFALGLLAGILFAAAAKALPLFEEIVRPVIGLMKTVPVVCFVVLFLVWWGSSFLSIAVSFLMVFTATYFSTLEGLKATPKGLLEAADAFRFPVRTRLRYVYGPALKPFLLGSTKSALGLAWKSGVAAEVIGLPARSIGEKLYLSKISLDTAGIFAWTAVTCVLCVLFERLVMIGMKALFNARMRCALPQKRVEAARELLMDGACKSYGGQTVLRDYSVKIPAGGTHWLTGPSGSGKTTTIRLFAGLEKPDAGGVQGAQKGACCMQFQEDRLCEEESALKNVEIVTGSEETAREVLEALLDASLIQKPCSELSGGERRRVALARALAAKGAYLLLDEPFAGLDPENAKRCYKEILARKGARTLVIASHLKMEE